MQRRGVYLTANQTALLVPPAEESDAWTTSSTDAGGPSIPGCGGLSAADVLNTKWRFAKILRRRCAPRVPSVVGQKDRGLLVSFGVRPAGDVIAVIAGAREPSHESYVDCAVDQAMQWKFPHANGYSDISGSVAFDER